MKLISLSIGRDDPHLNEMFGPLDVMETAAIAMQILYAEAECRPIARSITSWGAMSVRSVRRHATT